MCSSLREVWQLVVFRSVQSPAKMDVISIKNRAPIPELREMGDSDELAQIRQRRMAEMQAMQVCFL